MSASRSPAPAPHEVRKPDPVREELYALRNRILLATARLELADLRRVVELLDTLTDRDAQKIAAYASGLAAWPDPDASSR